MDFQWEDRRTRRIFFSFSCSPIYRLNTTVSVSGRLAGLAISPTCTLTPPPLTHTNSDQIPQCSKSPTRRQIEEVTRNRQGTRHNVWFFMYLCKVIASQRSDFMKMKIRHGTVADAIRKAGAAQQTIFAILWLVEYDGRPLKVAFSPMYQWQCSVAAWFSRPERLPPPTLA